MSSKRNDEAPSATSRLEGDGAHKRTFIDETDVEGHRMARSPDGAHTQRGVSLGEGAQKRNAIPDDGDDVEGHSILRGEGVRAPFSDDAISRGGDLGEGASRRVGPGEGHSSRT